MIIGIVYKYTSPSGKSYIGRYTGGRRDSKIVLKLTMSGQIIEEFESVKDAAISVGANETNIAKCCRGECKSIKILNGNIRRNKYDL